MQPVTCIVTVEYNLSLLLLLFLIVARRRLSVQTVGCRVRHSVYFYPEDGGSIFIRNVAVYL